MATLDSPLANVVHMAAFKFTQGLDGMHLSSILQYAKKPPRRLQMTYKYDMSLSTGIYAVY